ncbi:glutamine synthetase family protein [Celeribacter litoreus]|uniref:glutamine synthetase family protein n=1 Tax=Celeribacter litoreus TaxID=2876714 RepID=UPI001CCC863D|nr:glutamine synthetase family protein [Celeribacter litoreus]MCA0042495.1 glutamine synthetase family protein [Celeribacter litoreus]
MKQSDVMLACIADYGGRVRGKGYPVAEKEKYVRRGVGLAPTNLMITSFGAIVNSPWGPRGDLLMMPDPATEVVVDHGDAWPAERFVLCDLTTLDGAPWACCPRSWLKAGLARLEGEYGLRLYSAFEHEFHYTGVSESGGNAYALDSFRQQGDFLSRLVGALDEAGIEPEMVMPEYGAGQFEVTNSPAIGVASADRAVQLREVTRSVARAKGEKACFSPVMGAGLVGNGVHVHFSLQDRDGTPMSYDATGAHEMSAPMSAFVAGILAHMSEFLPLTASSAISYERLQPNRWSAAYNNLSVQDREAGLRICPLAEGASKAGFNVEYRASDASANPYLLLGALVWAGLEGLAKDLPAPQPTDGDPSAVPQAEAEKRGLKRLPMSLSEALDLMEASPVVREWMGDEFLGAYVMNKRSELSLLDGLDLDEQVAKYVDCF